MEKKNKIVIKNDKGEELECEVLFTYEDAKTNKNYLVYTDNSTNEEGQMQVYACTYDPTGKDSSLGKIETEEEWNTISNILSSLNEKVDGSNEE